MIHYCPAHAKRWRDIKKKLSKEQGRKIYKKLAATSYLNPHNSRNFQAHSNLIASDAIMKNWLSMNFNCFIPIPSFSRLNSTHFYDLMDI